jgi:two-component system sensor histidine kinase FlrB
MNLLSHLEPINESAVLAQPDVIYLTDAFSEFISASARLETSYGNLQLEVARLSDELAERNGALEASLAENERIHRALQRIVESMPCGVLVTDADGAVSMLNPEARRLLSLGEGMVRSLDAVSREAGVDLAGFLKTTSAESEQEFCRETQAGRQWLSVQGRRLFSLEEMDAAGYNRQQTILILRDVTTHKQMEAERERARRSIALSEVATTLAHEIRNPLASLELFAGLIGGSEEDAECVSHLRAGIRSLSATVNNVLGFHGLGYPSLELLDLSEAIRSCVEFARPIAAEAGVALVFVAVADQPVRVVGSSSLLQQMVLNMVCNAVRHTQPGGSIEVVVTEAGLGEQGSIALIRFRDTGCGIAPEHLPEIFRAGFSGSDRSTGLGLTVCSQIVAEHKGTIRVESRVGEGTTFYVEIPTV